VKIQSAQHYDYAHRLDKEKLAEARTAIQKKRKETKKKLENRAEKGKNALERYTFQTKCLRGVCVTNILIRQLIEQSASAVGGKCFRLGGARLVRQIATGSSGCGGFSGGRM